MTAQLTILASCLIGALIIEIRAHYLLRKIIHRRVMALFADDADRAQRRAEQSNYEQNKFHLASPLGRMQAQ